MSSKIVVGFLAGAAVGALAGILFAPEKGSDTRKKITGKAGDITDSLKTSFDDFVDGLKSAYAGSKESVSGGLLYRKQWVGIEDAPTTGTFFIHSPVGRNVGLGLSIISYLLKHFYLTVPQFLRQNKNK